MPMEWAQVAGGQSDPVPMLSIYTEIHAAKFEAISPLEVAGSWYQADPWWQREGRGPHLLILQFKPDRKEGQEGVWAPGLA